MESNLCLESQSLRGTEVLFKVSKVCEMGIALYQVKYQKPRELWLSMSPDYLLYRPPFQAHPTACLPSNNRGKAELRLPSTMNQVLALLPVGNANTADHLPPLLFLSWALSEAPDTSPEILYQKHLTTHRTVKPEEVSFGLHLKK